jgi:hypothetical protein
LHGSPGSSSTEKPALRAASAVIGPTQAVGGAPSNVDRPISSARAAKKRTAFALVNKMAS